MGNAFIRWLSAKHIAEGTLSYANAHILRMVAFQANVEVISRSTCNNLSAYRGQITAQMVCMGFLAGGIDTCQVITH